jgi:predicted nucleotidyltransferase
VVNFSNAYLSAVKSTEEIKKELKKLKEKLQKKYPIASLALFGSYSRNQQTDSSDVDLLIEFNGKIGSSFITLAEELEVELGESVDLVSKNGIRKKYFDQIKPDLVYV